MNAESNQPEPTAAATYATTRNDIARLLDVLQADLDAHADEAKADPKNWGFAGSLGKVRSDMIELVAFMSKRNRSDVEAALDEAR